MNNEKVMISNKQLTAIMVCLVWPTTINFCSGILTRLIGHDMWLSGVFGILTAMPFVYVVALIGRNFPGMTIAEYSQVLLGKILGKLLGLLLFLFFIINSALAVSAYIQHLTDFLLPETPFLVVLVMHVVVVCYLVWQGPETIARVGLLAFALSFIFFALIGLSATSEFDVTRLMPFFNVGVVNVGKASLRADSFTGVTQIVLAMMLPMAANQNKAFRSAATGLAIGGAYFVFYFAITIMIMGPQLVSIMRIPSMDLVRSIQITQYLHRFESFMVSLWYWSILIQAGALAYCGLQSLKQTVGIKQQKFYMILLFGLFLGGLTYYFGYNRVFYLNFVEYQWFYITLPFQFALPLLLLLVMKIKS